MADKISDRPAEPPPWTPDPFAIVSERTVDPNDAAPTFVSLWHPTAPYLGHVVAINDSNLQALGYDYLTRVRALGDDKRIDPPVLLPNASQGWIDALRPSPDPDPSFYWMPINWPQEYASDKKNAGDPLVSFRVERRQLSGARADGAVIDRSVVLLASQWLFSKFWPKGLFLGSGFGLRIVVHLRPANGGFDTRVTGLSAALPYGPYRDASNFLTDSDLQKSLIDIFQKKRNETFYAMADELDLQQTSLKIRGVRFVRVDNANQFEWRGTGLAKADATVPEPPPPPGRAPGDLPPPLIAPIPYAFTYLGLPEQGGKVLDRVPIAAHIAGEARVFARDAASAALTPLRSAQAVTRAEATLDALRVVETETATASDPLIYPPGAPPDGELVRVVVCPAFVRADKGKPVGDAKVVILPGATFPEVRGDDTSAVHAFRHVREFFQRLAAYGISAQDYFRIAKLPLRLSYRSGIRPGPGGDGQTVNARVLPDGWKQDFIGPTAFGDRPTMHMQFAVADLSTRARKPWDHVNRSPVAPLGIAADPRWVWHELGHVLLMARLGELEFRFAHSAGDALAAIACDPHSNLASSKQWRGTTFPWVVLTRRHDRAVSLGWSWGGTLHRDLAQAPYTPLARRKAYRTEQILSSSLFRLYRCLGGDTTIPGNPNTLDTISRASASHYAVYLIIRGIELMPDPYAVSPPNDPEKFMQDIVNADIGTNAWLVNDPILASQVHERVGGCANKLVRWAFEAQGLYAQPGVLTNAPGLSPNVDIYIADRRPTMDSGAQDYVDYGLGAYVPVSLEWDKAQKPSTDAPPLWHAAAAAITVSGANIKVKVGNRGQNAANGVTVSLWWHAWPISTDPPKWNDSGWTACTPGVSAPQNIASSATKTFGPFMHTPPAKRYILLAQATCGGDRANSDPAGGLPCASLPTPLVDLVAGDNNISLIVVKDP